MKFKFKEERQGKTVSINSTLSLILDSYNLRDIFIIDKLQKKWHSIVGQLMATHSIPGRIYKNYLFISVDHAVYSNELALMKDVLIDRINKEFGNELIKDIRLELKKLDWQTATSKKR